MNGRLRPRGDDLTQVRSQYLEEIDSVSLAFRLLWVSLGDTVLTQNKFCLNRQVF